MGCRTDHVTGARGDPIIQKIEAMSGKDVSF